MANENLFDLSDPMVKKISDHKASVKSQIMSIPGVVGCGVGMKREGGAYNPELSALRVYVKQKKSTTRLLDNERIPATYTAADGTVIAVDVVEVGTPRFLSFHGRYRPLKYGVGIGEQTVVADGTLGLVVKDLTDNENVILSCNHVLANWNTAPIGSHIYQQGPQHGGTGSDKIGTLKRFVPIGITHGSVNVVDAAIASIDQGVSYQNKTMCSYINVTKHCAVGMVFGGTTTGAIINPMGAVLSALNCSHPKVKAAAVGMAVHKCGSGTEYTSSVITDIDATLLMDWDENNTIIFEQQILTAGGFVEAAQGDSGAIVFTTSNC
jgi:hypothetical protein